MAKKSKRDKTQEKRERELRKRMESSSLVYIPPLPQEQSQDKPPEPKAEPK